MTKTTKPNPNPGAVALNFLEAAALAGVGRSTLYVAARKGALRVRKIGHRSVILRVDLIAWLDGLPAYQPASDRRPS